MSRNILIIDNFDSFTFNLAEYFRQLDCTVQVYRNTIDPAQITKLHPDAIVFSPGPSVPKNAGNMLEIIERYHAQYPMLGVCLGHEALIEYFGGALRFVPPVHGCSSKIRHDGKTLFSGLPQDFLAGRYHSLAAKKVPDCFTVSAKAEGIVMAIRHKTLPLEGVQFHPESVLTMAHGNGVKIVQNFLETYLPRKKQLHYDTIEFLEKTLAGEIDLSGQEEFLKTKQEISAEECAAIVRFFQKRQLPCPELKSAIDICGTGGSGLERINTSTLSAFLLSALDVPVAKHGNKAASGRYGSFDLLADLEIEAKKNPEEISTVFKTTNLAFLFAPDFHPAFRAFAAVRKKIGKPTIFNLLGPLLNPATMKRQIIGTPFREKMDLLAQTCHLLGKQHVLIVSGADGLDEVTLTGKTDVVEIKNGVIKKYSITPQDFGLTAVPYEKISASGNTEKLRLARAILQGTCRTTHRDLVCVNAALALQFFGKAPTLRAGYLLARRVLASGKVYGKYLEQAMLSRALGKIFPIIANKIQEVSLRQQHVSLKEIQKSVLPATRSFKQAIIHPGLSIIAEVKKKTPDGRKFLQEVSLAERARLYEANGARAISVVCDEKYFGGKLQDLVAVEKSTGATPLLCKDFIVSAYQVYEARQHGADAILLLASILSVEQIKGYYVLAKKLYMAAICEVHTAADMEKVLSTPVQIIGINNRCLADFSVDLNSTELLAKKIPTDKIIISESGFFTGMDTGKLPKNVQAILVGRSLMQSKNIAKTFQNFQEKRKPLLKICGIRSVSDAVFCEKAGVDFIGLNFVPGSKRKISENKAVEICSRVKAIQKVGVFQNQSLNVVNFISKHLELDYIQLCGDEDLEYIEKCGRPVIKTVRVKNGNDVRAVRKYLGKVAYCIFDGCCPGSGETFHHDILPENLTNCFLAGGIGAKNIRNIIQAKHPAGIDIASGAESNGRIDRSKILELLTAIHSSSFLYALP